MDASSSQSETPARADSPESSSSPLPRGRPFEPLHNKEQFDRVFAGGKRLRCGPFSLVVRPLEGSYRVGFKIGKKVGNAVLRNRLRRRFRSAFDGLHPLSPAGGAEIVVLASPATCSMKFSKLESRVRKALKKFGFIPRLPAEADASECSDG